MSTLKVGGTVVQSHKERPADRAEPVCPFCRGSEISPNTNFRGDKNEHPYQCNTCSHTF